METQLIRLSDSTEHTATRPVSQVAKVLLCDKPTSREFASRIENPDRQNKVFPSKEAFLSRGQYMYVYMCPRNLTLLSSGDNLNFQTTRKVFLTSQPFFLVRKSCSGCCVVFKKKNFRKNNPTTKNPKKDFSRGWGENTWTHI